MLSHSITHLFDSQQKYFYTLQVNNDHDLRVVSFSLYEEISQPFKATIVVASTSYHLDFSKFLDHTGLFTLYRNGEVQRYLHGVITSIAKGDRKNRYYLYTLTLEPRIFKLGLRQNVRIFQQQSVEKIVTTLLKESGVFFFNWSLTAKYDYREYCVQYRETDLAFIDRLLAEEGMSYYFEHLEDRHIFVVYDRYTGTGALDRKIPYHLPQGGAAPAESIYSLYYREEIGFSHVKLTDYCFKKSAYTLSNDAQADLSSQGQNRQYFYYDYPGRYKEDISGERYTRKRLAKLRKALNTAEVNSDVLSLIAGYRLTLEDHIDDSLNRDWLVAKITHEGTQHQVLEEEGIEGTALYHNQATLIDAKSEWLSEGNSKPQIDGSQIAVVVGPDNEEIYCDEYARVRVKFPWDIYRTPEPSNDSGLSCWIRVSQDWAGAGWGSMQLPRVGQEVIVTFLNGDPDQPIITGRVYNNLQTTPYKMPRYKTVTTIKSKEVQGSGYNELILDDTYTKIKAMLHSTHGASQLSLGYIKSEHRVDKHPDHRGDGFELRTDEWGAIRAGKGLYISTDIREKAEKKQLDLEESIVQLEQALALARELARAADTSQTYRTDVDNQESQFKGVYQELKSPGMLLNSPEGITLTSPKSIQASSSQNIALTSYQSIDMSSFKDFRVAAKTNVSILAVEKDLNLIANQGRMKIQAQNNELELSSKQELRVISNDNSIVIAAQNGIKLVSGGAYILIKDGKVEIGGPQPLDIKTAGFNVVGSNNMPYNFTNYGSENPMLNDEMFVIKDDEGNPIPGFKYKIEREDGEVFRGRTNHKGETMRIGTGNKELGLKVFPDRGNE